jgi:hypothetical protein
MTYDADELCIQDEFLERPVQYCVYVTRKPNPIIAINSAVGVVKFLLITYQSSPALVMLIPVMLESQY